MSLPQVARDLSTSTLSKKISGSTGPTWLKKGVLTVAAGLASISMLAVERTSSQRRGIGPLRDCAFRRIQTAGIVQLEEPGS